MAEDSDQLWAIVLAAGEGRRLASLTRALYGRELPKQFAVISHRRSLLQATMDRLSAFIPACHTVVVVAQEHESLAREQLSPYLGVQILLQPKNLDTAPGIFLPLTHVWSKDPGATVVICPSDHHVPTPAPLLRAIREAAVVSRESTTLLTLLGVVPDYAETEYGWIVPGEGIMPGGTLRPVQQFVEKPAEPFARDLWKQGALWNTFISVGQVAAFWSLAKRLLPNHSACFEHYAKEIGGPRERTTLERIYVEMSAANFSRCILERAQSLATMSVEGSGWSDWGSPERVFRSLAGTRELAPLYDRMQPDRAGDIQPCMTASHK